MKIVFAGTPLFAAYALERLVKEGHDVQLVLSQPDKPAGRGRKLKMSEVKEFALNNSIEVMTPRTLRREKGGEETAAVYRKISELQPDLLVVAAYGLILPQEFLDLPRGILRDKYPNLKAINIHGSILPKWRGAAPIARGIENGDKEAGITLMQMDAGLDTGPMLYKQAVEIRETDTTGTLTERLGKMGAEMLSTYLKKPQAYPPVPQEKSNSYAKKIEKNEGKISWQETAKTLSFKIKAFNPFPGCVFKRNGEELKVWFANEAEGKTKEPVGTVVNVTKEGIYVACGKGSVICLKELQKPGGKKLPAQQFLNGTPVLKGEIFSDA